jgi:sporulation protein YlmC with PRC-barrel domain
MMKKLMLGAALSALVVSGALAQAPNLKPIPPAATQKSSPPAAAPKSNLPATAQNEQGKGKPNFVMAQKPDQFLASKFRGTEVLGADNKKIGDVSDILFDQNGKIEAYVISVGGFLGMGAKHVALAPNSFDLVPGKKGGSPQLKLSMNQNELKQARNFAPYSPPRPHPTTTGSGGLGGPPLGGGLHPPGGAQR